jgi:hypothetical protein
MKRDAEMMTYSNTVLDPLGLIAAALVEMARSAPPSTIPNRKFLQLRIIEKLNEFFGVDTENPFSDFNDTRLNGSDPLTKCLFKNGSKNPFKHDEICFVDSVTNDQVSPQIYISPRTFELFKPDYTDGKLTDVCSKILKNITSLDGCPKINANHLSQRMHNDTAGLLQSAFHDRIGTIEIIRTGISSLDSSLKFHCDKNDEDWTGTAWFDMYLPGNEFIDFNGIIPIFENLDKVGVRRMTLIGNPIKSLDGIERFKKINTMTVDCIDQYIELYDLVTEGKVNYVILQSKYDYDHTKRVKKVALINKDHMSNFFSSPEMENISKYMSDPFLFQEEVLRVFEDELCQ